MCACAFCTLGVFNVFVHSVQTLYGRGVACASRNTLSLLVVPSGC